MADDGSNQGNTDWPLPKFYFKVHFGNGMGDASFQEVTGLDIKSEEIEYRHGDSPVFSSVKMPGLVKVGNVTLKKGIFQNDKSVFDWFNRIKMNTIKRETVTISLLDEGGNAALTWTLKNAWPNKVNGTDLKSDGNEIAIESIEIVLEGLTVENN